MNRGWTNLRAVSGGILLLLVLFCATVRSNPAQPTDRATGNNTVSDTCVLSGKVINFDTNEPVPYFRLIYMKGSGALIEYIETDEKGHFRTTAPRGSERYFKYDFSRQGTYLIDWDRQDSSVPFRGTVRIDITDFIFKVKFWPVTTLTGKVLDELSEPADNASVYFHHYVPEVKTDATGTFCLQVAPTDRDFDLFVISEDEKHAKLVHLKAGSTTADITLEPTKSYKGRVMNTKNRLVWPFKFRVGLMLNGEDLNFCWSEEIQTDKDGTFTIDCLYPKTSYIAQWFPDEEFNPSIGQYGKKSIDLAKHDSNENIEITVVQYLNTLTGKVIDINNVPIEGAKYVVGTRNGIQSQSGWGKPFYSDKNGRFSIRNLADGQVFFHSSKKGYKAKDTWAPTDSTDIEIVLEPLSDTSICEVHVVDDEYKPVLNAPVKLDFIGSDKLLLSRITKTNAEGKVEFEIKDYGDDVRALGIVSCDMDGYDYAYNSIVDNRNAQVKLVLHKAGENWSGTIVDSKQKPIAGAKLYLVSMTQRVKTPQRKEAQSLDQSFFSDPSEATFITQTDAKGEFTLQRFNKKDFVRIAVKAPGFKTQEINFSPEDNTATIFSSPRFTEVKDFMFQLPSGVAIVKGLLIEESSGKPISNANIELRDENNKSRYLKTDEDGTFFIEDLDPGEYVPVLKTSGGASNKNYICVPDVLIAEANETMQVTFKAREGIHLKGRLIESRTQRRPSAERVYLDARLKSGQTISTDFIEKDSSWELLLPSGEYDLYYSIFYEDISRFIDSEEPFSITVENKEYENLVLEIGDQGTLSLQPPSLTGRPLPNLKDLSLKPLPETTNKIFLFCFFDMGQRPSRNCIMQLVRQANELKQKDVVVAIIQLSKVDEKGLNEWAKEQKIPFPVGVVPTNVEETKANWGVKSLPWLILTDKKHVVTAEGFSIIELEEKLKVLTDN